MRTLIADSKGFVWIAGTAAQDGIINFTRDGKFVFDFGHRPPAEPGMIPENDRRRTSLSTRAGASSMNDKRSLHHSAEARLIYDATTGAYKRGWGGHSMPLAIPRTADPAVQVGRRTAAAGEELRARPTLCRISRDREVYIGERGQNRISVPRRRRVPAPVLGSPNTPARGEGCGGLNKSSAASGTTYKLAISRDPQQSTSTLPTAPTTRYRSSTGKSGETLGSIGQNGRYAGDAALDRHGRDRLEGQHLQPARSSTQSASRNSRR